MSASTWRGLSLTTGTVRGRAWVLDEPAHELPDGFDPAATVLVAIDSDVNQVQSVLQTALDQVPDVLADPPAQVFFKSISADGLEWTVYFWVTDQLQARSAVLSRLNHAVWSGLQAANIKLPPPKAVLAPYVEDKR